MSNSQSTKEDMTSDSIIDENSLAESLDEDDKALLEFGKNLKTMRGLLDYICKNEKR